MKSNASRGVALPTVVLALVLLETLIAVAFVGVLAWSRAARWGVAEAQAANAVEAGLAQARRAVWAPAWDTASGRVLIASDRLPGGGNFAASIAHLAPRVTAVIVEGTRERSEATVIAGEIGVRRPVVPSLRAALTYGGGLDVEGVLLARGAPAVDEWSACGAPRAAADLLDLPGTDAVALFDALPHETWRPFARPLSVPLGAAVSPEPVELGGVCAAGVWSNWGDPLDPLAACGSHSATVYYDGALRIAGGRGQGTLVVSGDLTVGGGFVFHGLVAVRGRLLVEAPGFSVVGTLLVGEVLGQRHAVRGMLAVQYSKCFLEMWLPASGKPDRLPGPSWLQLFEVP